MKTVSPERPGLTFPRFLNERPSHFLWDRAELANPVSSFRHDFRLRDIRFQQFLHLRGNLNLAAHTHHLHGNHSPCTNALCGAATSRVAEPAADIRRLRPMPCVDQYVLG